MLKTFFALVMSTGLVACVTDDSIETEELAENPVLPRDQGDVVDIKENPGDIPGTIPAQTQDGTHVPIQNQVTTDMGVNRGTNVTGTVNRQGSTDDLGFNRGAVDGSHVTGEAVGSSCDGQGFDCRTSAPQVIDGSGGGDVYIPSEPTAPGKPGRK